jgi:hypothetical protein
MAPRRRAVSPPSTPPEFYTPPTLQTPSPKVTERITENHAAREITLGSVSGKRSWAWGRQRLGGKVQYSYKYLTNEVWLVIELCKGECDSLVRCLINGTPWPATANTISSPGQLNIWWYPGTPSGTVDSHLAAVDLTWNEAFAGTSYAVVQFQNLDRYWPERPNIVFEMLTYKPIDPRTDARAYSENPFVQWWDWLLDAEGKNMPLARLLKQSFKDAADLADQTVGSRKRFEAHPLLMDATDVDDVIKMFRLMTNSWFMEEGGTWKVIPDQPVASVATYGDANLSRSVTPAGRGEDDLQRPNQVVVEYTDTANDWKSTPVTVQTAAVDSAAEQPLPANFKMPWIHDKGLATSIGKYILNGYLFDRKLFVRWNETTSDRSLGDVVTQGVPARGLNFVGRFLSRKKTTEKNVYDVILAEYNAARYSDDVLSSAGKTGSTLPNPNDVPPDVTLATVTITEELFRPQPGWIVPRGKITITNPNFYFLDAVELWYRINLGTYRFYADFPGGSAQIVDLMFEGVNEVGVPYDFKFITRSRFGVKSAGVIKTPSTTFQGKTAAPQDVSGFFASPLGDQIHLAWQQTPDPDILEYEVRRGTTADTWDTAGRIGRFKGLETFDRPPAGLWRYFVKSIDFSGNASTNAATSDLRTFFVGPQNGTEQTLDFVFTQTGHPNFGPNWFGDTYIAPAVSGMVNTILAVEGVTIRQTVSIFMTRGISPAEIDFEISINGYASISAWETNLDLPRRQNAALWAPLHLVPDMSFGTWMDKAIVGDSAGFRNAEWKVRPATVKRVGSSTGICSLNVFCEQLGAPWWDTAIYGTSTNASRWYMPTHSDFNGFRLNPGVILSTNTQFAQVIAQGPANAFWYYAYQQKQVDIAKGDITTDGSGLAQLAFPTPMKSGQVPTVEYSVTSNHNVTLIVTSLDNTQYTVKALNPSTGAAVSGVSVRMSAVDRGLGGFQSTIVS